MLSLGNISLSYGGPLLFDNVNLQIEPGDRLCLLGRNGSGKSTLLKIINGEISPDQGEIVRKQGLRVALVSQEVPQELTGTVTGTVFDVVAAGMGDIVGLLAEYHFVGQKLATEGGERWLARHSALQKALDDSGGWHLQQEVQRILSLLALDQDAEFSVLSGGIKRRVLLARALVSSPDILLLDEPTNHLDIDTIVWLEEFLLKNVMTLLFVTHDRAFANKIANRIAEIDRGRIYSFSCGYDTFIARRVDLLEAEITRRVLFDKKLAQEEAWIRQGVKARRTRNEGRVQALKRMRAERRQRRDRPGAIKFQVQEAERSGSLVVKAEGISFAYDGPLIIKNLSTTIMRGDRVGIIGPNGSGKTTLLRLLLGDISPQHGKITLGSRLSVLYFDQLRDQLDLAKTVQENVGEGSEILSIGGKSRHIIGYLQDFLFSADRARTPVHILSGGERNRLLLAKLFLKPSNVLVMDEPTNDLDTETLELLEDLLLEYSGTLLLVSHDREFLNNVVTSILAIGQNGEVSEYVGGYDDWLSLSSALAPDSAPVAPKSAETRPRRQTERPRKLSFKEERELEGLPDRISSLEAEQENLHQTLADPNFYRTTGNEVTTLTTRLTNIEKDLKELYRRWEEIEAIGK